MQVDYLIGISAILFLVVGGWHGKRSEAKNFNSGICTKCGSLLKRFDMDSQGGRGYSCNSCDRTVWVSYPSVDRNYSRV